MARCRPAKRGPHRWIATPTVREERYGGRRPPTAYRLCLCKRCGSRAWGLDRGGHRDTTAWKFVGLEESDGPYAFSTAIDPEIPWTLVALLFAAAAVVSLTISAALGRL